MKAERKNLTQLSYCYFDYRFFFKRRFCKRKANINKINKVSVLKGMFSETTYVCLRTYQTSSFWPDFNEF